MREALPVPLIISDGTCPHCQAGSTISCVAGGLSPAMAPVPAILAVDLVGTALVLEEFGRVIALGGAGIVIASMAGYRQPPLDDTEADALANAPADELLTAALPGRRRRSELGPGLRAVQASQPPPRPSRCRRLERTRRPGQLPQPGVILTPLAQTELDSDRGPAFQTLIQGSPAGRVGTAREVAAAAAFLLIEPPGPRRGADTPQ